MKPPESEAEYEARFPQKDFGKTIYSFIPQELRKVQSLDTIAQLGQIAQAMINQVVQGECLKRVGVKNSPDVGVLYNVPTGQFFVYTPKLWCSSCKIRRALYVYNNQNYCGDCLNLVKTVETSPVKTKAKKRRGEINEKDAPKG